MQETCSKCAQPMHHRQTSSAAVLVCLPCRDKEAAAILEEQTRTGLKTCVKCDVPKLLDDFGRDAKRPDGRFPYCKLCRRQPKRVEQTNRAQALVGLENVSHHPLWPTWDMMIWRCENPKHQAYKNYGGRGITVYGPWHDAATFIHDVLSELGPRPPGMTLDRIDNDGPYAPGKVRWATQAEQSRNQRTRDGLTPAELEQRRATVKDLLNQGRTWHQITEATGASKWAIRGDIDLIRRQARLADR